MDAIDRQSITDLNISDALSLAALVAQSIARAPKRSPSVTD
jgi:hypothetical protein